MTSTVDSAALVAIALASGMALAALLRGAWRGAWALTLLCSVTAALAVVAICPSWWNAIVAGCTDAVGAWLVAMVGVEALRHAGRFVPRSRAVVGTTALALVATLGCVGAIVAHIPGGPRIGYRGLLVVDAAAAVVLLVVRAGVAYYRMEREPVAETALRWLTHYQVARVIYVGLWEPLPEVAAHPVTVFGLAALYVWAMLAVRDAALRTTPPEPRPRPLREATT